MARRAQLILLRSSLNALYAYLIASSNDDKRIVKKILVENRRFLFLVATSSINLLTKYLLISFFPQRFALVAHKFFKGIKSFVKPS